MRTISAPDGLLEAIRELDTAEVHASLAAQGMTIHPADAEANVRALAHAMLA